MSITVRDLLKLPALKQSRLVAGAGGLDRIVSSISVLETVDLDMLPSTIFQNNQPNTGEIVITGFLNCTDNEKLQCALVQRLSDEGEVGIILYYVGLCVPKVGEKLKALCDALDFVLICMPEGTLSFRYSEVIYDVMEAVICDRMEEHMHFTNELLGEISRMPRRCYSVDTMLQLISKRLHVFMLLADKNFRVLNSVSWPAGADNPLESMLELGWELPSPGWEPYSPEPESFLYRLPLFSSGERQMELMLLKTGNPLRRETASEVVDLVQLAVNLWNSNHDAVEVTELIRAMVQDEPLKLRGLASIFGVNTAALHVMGILRPQSLWDSAAADQVKCGLREILAAHFDAVVVGTYEGAVMFFTSPFPSLAEEQQITGYILGLLDHLALHATLTWCTQLDNTTQVAKCYELHQAFLNDARNIYPTQRVFHRHELEFAQRCRNLISQGEDALQLYLRILDQISQKTEGDDFIETLSVFLLDTDSSLTETSRRMYLHKNTIKYRIRRCSDLVGYRIGTLPETIPLYTALAVRRMLA